MKCERCGIIAADLHDYCEACSKNLCATCMRDGRCAEAKHEVMHKHVPANQGDPGAHE